MRIFYSLVFALMFCISSQAQLVISEIMYNSPESGNDSLEYIEITNVSNADVNLSNYKFTAGVTYTLPNITLKPKQYFTVGKDSVAIKIVLGVDIYEWKIATDGLNNGGEKITLADLNGTTVDEVTYDDIAPWPTDANGSGASLVLCDLNADNSLAASWKAATNGTGAIINNREIKGSPNKVNDESCKAIEKVYPLYTIEKATKVAADGKLDSVGKLAEVVGTVHGFNIRSNGLSFVLIDEMNNGIVVFLTSGNLGFTPVEGKKISVKGLLEQFNGLAEIIPDVITEMGNGTIVNPKTVSSLVEGDESSLVKVLKLNYVDINEWKTDSTAFDLNLTDGTNKFLIRVERNKEIAKKPAPKAPFDVIGFVGQRDATAPFTEGYQLQPRKIEDFTLNTNTDDFESALKLYPTLATTEINIVDEDGDIRIVNIQITDIQGHEVLESTNARIDISNLKSGTYFAKIKTESFTILKKFIKL